MIAKSRHFLKNNPQQLLSIYHSIFSSLLIYGCQVWGLTDTNSFKKIQTLQNNALRLISFAESFRDHITPTYHDWNLLKIRDLVTLKNILFVHDFFNNKLPESFAGYFKLSSDMHSHGTRSAIQNQLFLPCVTSTAYGRKSFKITTILSWNHFTKLYPNTDLLNLSYPNLKRFIIKHFIDSYA